MFLLKSPNLRLELQATTFLHRMIYPHKWVDCVGVIPHVCISYVAILSGIRSPYTWLMLVVYPITVCHHMSSNHSPIGPFKSIFKTILDLIARNHQLVCRNVRIVENFPTPSLTVESHHFCCINITHLSWFTHDVHRFSYPSITI